MSQILKITILALATSLLLGSNISYAENTNEEQALTSRISISESYHVATTYSPVVIPKASNLPGPDHNEIAKTSKGDAAAEDKGARRSLIRSVLPKFAVSTVGIVGILALVFLVIGGLRYVTSYGNDENIEKAKKQVIYSLVGLMIALLSYTIVAIVTNLEFEGNETTIRDQQKAELKKVEAEAKAKENPS
jgi:hypothetical protein